MGEIKGCFQKEDQTKTERNNGHERNQDILKHNDWSVRTDEPIKSKRGKTQYKATAKAYRAGQ